MQHHAKIEKDRKDRKLRIENHALTLGSRPFGSIGDSRTSLGGRHFGSGPDGRVRSFESVLGANVDRLRVFLLR